MGRSIFDKDEPLSSNVVICVPTNGLVHSRFTYCLVRAITYTQNKGIPVTLEMDEGTVLSNQRQALQDRAIDELKAEHILWLDSDMTFPPNVIIRLLKHKKDVICATYSKRVPPFHPTAFQSINPVRPVDLNHNGLEVVKYAGMGCMLVKASIIDHLPSPHYPLQWDAQAHCWHGEDMGFCDQLDKEGIKLYCDLQLSREIGHVGQQEFLLK